MTRSPRRRRSAELSRGRFRTLFFALLATLCLLVGSPFGAIVALVGTLIGLHSVKTARSSGHAHAHTYAVLDWLVLGVTLALAGNVWLELAVIPLIVGHLVVSDRSEWPFLLAPTLLLLIVMAIADPTLGGDRNAGLARYFVMIAGAGAVAHELSRPRSRKQRAASVDPATGFYTHSRLHDVLADQIHHATARHEALGIVCLKLDHFSDAQNFLGAQGSEELVANVARRVKRNLQSDDIAFRVAADTFVLALPGRSPTAARQEATAICHGVAGTLIERQKQTLTAGTASFPTVRTLDALLREASAGLRATPQPLALAQ